jgi:hypothetical protein
VKTNISHGIFKLHSGIKACFTNSPVFSKEQHVTVLSLKPKVSQYPYICRLERKFYNNIEDKLRIDILFTTESSYKIDIKIKQSNNVKDFLFNRNISSNGSGSTLKSFEFNLTTGMYIIELHFHGIFNVQYITINHAAERK